MYSAYLGIFSLYFAFLSDEKMQLIATKLSGRDVDGVSAGVTITFFSGLVFLIVYIYTAILVQKIAKKLNNKHPWMAWIPIVNLYLLYELSNTPQWTLIIFIVTYAMTSLPFLSGYQFIDVPASVIMSGITMLWLWKVCQHSQFPGWWSIFSYIFPPVWWVLLAIVAWQKPRPLVSESVSQ